MTALNFPFTALVELDALKLVLQLAAIDHRLSVLIRGDKGAGKSTAARALADLLPEGSPFVTLPIGATEDRVLGGLDIERAIKGEPALKPGLLAAAHGGVLYIDEVNLLPDHLADAMLDAVASGIHVIEREGFSEQQDVRFVLVGSMNPEEGALRPQLLDRFALVVDVFAPSDVRARRAAVERRLAFDADGRAFLDDWRQAQHDASANLRDAQERVRDVRISADMLDVVAERVSAHAVRSLRADLAIVRASRALAALDGTGDVTAEHVETVLPFALAHRAPFRHPPAAPPPPPPSSRPNEGGDAPSEPERIFEVRPVDTPRVGISDARVKAGAAASAAGGVARGPVVRAHESVRPAELDVRATLVQSVARTGVARISDEHLQEKVRAKVSGRRFLFVIDSSGSQAAQQRMQLVKGTVAGLLESSVRRHDEIAVVVFRGAEAEVALHPTCDPEEARNALSYLATGGRTPLAHGLELAAGLVTDDTALILLTDGRANVALRSDDPWADALEAASKIQCAALVVDSEVGPNPSGRARDLARQLRAQYAVLDGLDQHGLLALVRPPASLGSS